MEEIPLCIAQTQKGQPCTRPAKRGPLCTQHHKIHAKHPYRMLCIDDPEPWRILRLEACATRFLSTEHTVRTRLRKACWDGPSRRDRQGWIYVYTRDADGSLPYYKVGCTERSPAQRMKEWSNAHAHDTLSFVRGFGVAHHKFAERLLFVLMDTCRIVRHYNEEHKVYIATHHDTGTPVTRQDADRVKRGWTDTEACKRYIEWFQVAKGTPVLFQIIRAVVTLVNAWERRFAELKAWSAARTLPTQGRLA